MVINGLISCFWEPLCCTADKICSERAKDKIECPQILLINNSSSINILKNPEQTSTSEYLNTPRNWLCVASLDNDLL